MGSLQIRRPTLICTVGLPRSGKSTWSREQGYPVVNRDAIRLAFHGERFLPQAEEWIALFAKMMVTALFEAGHATVIVDETNTTHKRRAFWKSLPFCRASFKHIDTPKKTCIQRAKEEGDDSIIPIIERMAEQFEPLDDDEERFELVERKRDEAVRRAKCDVCAGTQKLLNGAPCACGDGSLHGLVAALRAKLTEVEHERDEARRERDEALEECRRACRECCQAWFESGVARKGRDEATARAEKAERERDRWHTSWASVHDAWCEVLAERDAAVARAEKAEREEG